MDKKFFDNGIVFSDVLWQIWHNTKILQTNYPEPWRMDDEDCYLNWLIAMDESFNVNMGDLIGAGFDEKKYLELRYAVYNRLFADSCCMSSSRTHC